MRLARFAAGIAVLLAVTGVSTHHALARACGQRSASFEYVDTVEGATIPSLPSDQQQKFEASFCVEASKVENWFVEQKWWQPAPSHPGRFIATHETYFQASGKFDGPFPDLKVVVSGGYQISRALVPSFLGRRGRMEFPAARVAVDEAAIGHELVHVFFPNGNRMLTEGFSTYVQRKLTSNPTYPDFNVPFNQMVSKFLCDIEANRVDVIDLTKLDKVSTPTDMILRIGHQQYGDKHNQAFYAIAASLVEFLIDKYGMEKFRSLYARSPMIPFQRNAGLANRWEEVYGKSLANLEKEWQASVGTINCSR